MLVRALFLLFFPLNAYCAGVSIEIDSSDTIGSIVYSDDAWDALEVDESVIDSYKYTIIDYAGERPQTNYETDDLSLEFLNKSGATLNKLTLSPAGHSEVYSYPAISNDFERFIQIDGIPFILDSVADIIYAWNGELSYWEDLSQRFEMPGGEYIDIINIRNNLVLSTEEGMSNGLWHVAVTPYQLTDTLLSESKVIYTPFGSMQLHVNEDNQYAVHWIGLDKPVDILPVSNFNARYLVSFISGSGTLSLFASDHLTFLWSGVSGHIEILPPNNTTRLMGCYTSSYPHLFCAFETSDGEVVLFELKDGVFRADSRLGVIGDYIDRNITSVHAVGSKRFLATVAWGSVSSRFTLSVVESDQVAEVTNFDVLFSNNEDVFYIFPSKNLTDFYWLGVTNDKIYVNKIKPNGSRYFIENTYGHESSRNGTAIGLDDKNASASTGKGGALNLNFLFFFLLFFFARKRSVYSNYAIE